MMPKVSIFTLINALYVLYPTSICLAQTNATSNSQAIARQDASTQISNLNHKLASLGSRINALKLAGAKQIPAEFPDGATNIQAQSAIAKDYLLTGNPSLAVKIAENALEKTHGFSSELIADLQNIIIGSYNELESPSAVIRNCQQNIATNLPATKLTHTDNLLTICAYNHFLQSKNNPPEAQSFSIQQTLEFAWHPQTIANIPNNLGAAILLSQALINLNKDVEALKYLTNATILAKPNSPWLPRAKFILALHSFAQGKTEAALAEVLTIANSSPLPDLQTQYLTSLFLARYQVMHNNLPAAETYYKNILTLNSAETANNSPAKANPGEFININESIYQPNSLNIQINQVKYEYAGVLFYLNKYSESIAIYEDLLPPNLSHKNTPEKKATSTYFKLTKTFLLQYSKALIQEEIKTRKEENKLTALLGKLQADLTFLNSIKSENINIRSLTYLSKTLVSLNLLAENVGYTSSELSGQNNLHDKYLAVKNTQAKIPYKLSLALAQNLQINNSANNNLQINALAELKLLFGTTIAYTKELSNLSQYFWQDKKSNATNSQNKIAQALLTRMENMQDTLTEYFLTTKRENNFKLQNEYLTSIKKIQLINKFQREMLAKYAAIIVAGNSFSNNYVSLADFSNLNPLIIETELSLLQENNPTINYVGILKNYPKLNSTLKELYSFHKSLLPNKGNLPTKEEQDLIVLWQQLFATFANLKTSAMEIVVTSQKEQKLVQLQTENILQSYSEAQSQLLKIEKKIQTEAKVLLPLIAKQISANYNNLLSSIKLNVNSANLNSILNNVNEQNTLSKAKEERKLWLEKLQNSQEWDLLR